MKDAYRIPSGSGTAEFTEKRSRFIGHIWHVTSEAQALEHIAWAKGKYHDARHTVYAYLLRDTGIMRYSDDGEPQGTAGMPVLEVLRRGEVTDVCCVVTRYFGGILLGAGGLTRAYARSARDTLEATGISVMQPFTELSLSCPYALFERIKRDLAAFEGQLADAQYGAEIDLRLLLPKESAAAFAQTLTEQSGGALHATVTGTVFQGVPVKAPTAPNA